MTNSGWQWWNYLENQGMSNQRVLLCESYSSSISVWPDEEVCHQIQEKKLIEKEKFCFRECHKGCTFTGRERWQMLFKNTHGRKIRIIIGPLLHANDPPRWWSTFTKTFKSQIPIQVKVIYKKTLSLQSLCWRACFLSGRWGVIKLGCHQLNLVITCHLVILSLITYCHLVIDYILS